MLATAITIPVTNASKQENSTTSLRSTRILAPPLRLPPSRLSGHQKGTRGTGIARAGDDDRYILGRRLGGERGGIAECDNDIDVGGFELGHETVEPLGVRVGTMASAWGSWTAASRDYFLGATFKLCEAERRPHM